MRSAISRSAASESPQSRWLAENGPRELEQLFRAIVCRPAAPVVVTDGDHTHSEAMAGAGRLPDVSRKQIIGGKPHDFQPALKLHPSELWRAFIAADRQEHSFHRETPADGRVRPAEYKDRINVLPLRDKTRPAESETPLWVRDYALFLLDSTGHIAAWYDGAAHIYGLAADQALGHHISCLYSDPDDLKSRLTEELKRAESSGHFGNEGWHVRKDGSRFWANVITMALRDEKGELQGFGRAVRDFTDRHERDEKLRRDNARVRPMAAEETVAGFVVGELDRTPEVNDAFLDIVGYTREDVEARRMRWFDLTPPEYAALDEVAHEESLRFGACTPYEKELISKDGTRIPVLITTAVLKISPFRWITFARDLRERNRVERIDDPGDESTHGFSEMVGSSEIVQRVQRLIEVVAPTDATVLILGETGTGKELAARAVHRMSPRKNLPFITLNCAAIPTGLLESELFGYERGAFTGALQQKIGRFEMAHRGTLFLDEVGDIPIDLQPKLLRALQEKSFERLGGTKTIPIDVRLVAATNRDLQQMMGDKLFRSDLYYRLKVFPITTPPLRDRPEDIPVLARHFTRIYSARMNRSVDKIPAETMRALASWPWPGNVRELENFIERSVILSTGSSLRAPLGEIRPEDAPAAMNITLEQVEREHIVRILRDCGGVVTSAATRLGLHRTTLNAVMRKHGISRKDL